MKRCQQLYYYKCLIPVDNLSTVVPVENRNQTPGLVPAAVSGFRMHVQLLPC